MGVIALKKSDKCFYRTDDLYIPFNKVLCVKANGLNGSCKIYIAGDNFLLTIEKEIKEFLDAYNSWLERKSEMEYDNYETMIDRIVY